MDRIEKALQKLSAKERKVVLDALIKIRNRQFDGMDIKKLQGNKNILRARKGNIRIIFRRDGKNAIFILAIERRTDKTYNKF